MGVHTHDLMDIHIAMRIQALVMDILGMAIILALITFGRTVFVSMESILIS
jgi:hypothetical protein